MPVSSLHSSWLLAVSLTCSMFMQRKIHGHLFYYCDIASSVSTHYFCLQRHQLFAVCCLLSSQLFLTLALRFDHCLLAAGSERMNKNEFMHAAKTTDIY